MPYRVSKQRHDQDNKGELVSTYDVVFHEDVQSYLVYPDFQKFMADTAIDGVNRVLQQDKEKLSSDYKILKNMKCKGGEPAMMTVKKTSNNPLIDNMDIDKAQSKLQKEIHGIKDEQMQKEEKEAENQRRLDEAQKRFDNGEVDEDEDGEQEEEEPKPKGII
mmetsp:Transcript_41249/g.62791  ORF Transcript_41249/g.62791 Transcript_41249/m.62791 type:complete len:162 (+) Transcript_41249:515-1000(+)